MSLQVKYYIIYKRHLTSKMVWSCLKSKRTSSEGSTSQQNKQKTFIRKTKDPMGGCCSSRHQKYKRGLDF